MEQMPGHLRLLGSRQKRTLTEMPPPSVCDVVLKNYSPVPSFPTGGGLWRGWREGSLWAKAMLGGLAGLGGR